MNRLLILAAAIAAASFAPAATALGSVGLVGYWPFDEAGGETVFDSSGHGNHGVLGATDAHPLNNPLRVGGHTSAGALFSDGHEWVTLGPSPEFNPAKLTIGLWMQSTDASGYNALVRYHEPHCYVESYALYGQDGYLRLHVQLSDNSFVQSGTLADASQLYDGGWHHVAATFDGIDAKLYVDGTLVTDGASAPLGISTPIALFSANEPVEGGNGASCEALGLDTGYHGTMDELNIWNRALSESEVEELAGSPSPPLPEWPAIMLMGAGLAVVLAFAHRKKAN